MHDPAASGQDGKLDLVPMIDCIMLLLLFFILTTKFTAPERALAALLPTDQGPTANPQPSPANPKLVNIAVYPAGLAAQQQPSAYQAGWERLRGDGRTPPAVAMLRIGGSDPLRIDGTLLAGADSPPQRAEIERIHRYIADELAGREEQGARKEQAAITIHCFSGLPWRDAVVVYDAVRAFEAARSGLPPVRADEVSDPRALEDAREVAFAPPRLRNYSQLAIGNELDDIVNLR